MFVDKWEYLPRACNGAHLVRCPHCRRILSDSDIGMVRRHCPNCGNQNELESPSEPELAERWCPMSVAHPVREDQEIRLCVPGILDDSGPIRFGDIYWTEADE